MVKESSIAIACKRASEVFPRPVDSDAFEDVSYGQKNYTSIDRADLRIAIALRNLQASPSDANEIELANEIFLKMSIVEYKRIKEEEAKAEAAAIKAAKKLEKTVEAAVEAVKNPEVKRTRKSRVANIEFQGVAKIVDVPAEQTEKSELVDSATASSIAEAIQDRQIERQAFPMGDRVALGSDDALRWKKTPDEAEVADPFTEVKTEDIQPIAKPQPTKDDMDEFIRQQKEKLTKLAGIKPTENSAL